MENQRAVLESVGAQIGVKKGDLSSWYKVNSKTLWKFGLSRLLSLYSNSISTMLKKVYPEYDWIPWKFKNRRATSHRDPEMVEQALKYIESECGIIKPEQWYSISEFRLKRLGVKSLMSHFGGLIHVLKQYRPAFSWDEAKFVGIQSVGLKTLGFALWKIWPNLEILERYGLSDSMTVNFFIPTLTLAFDYQGVSEFVEKWTDEEQLMTVIENKEKLDLAKSQNISLVSVPFWWDRSAVSLAATVIEIDINLKSSMNERLFRNLKDEDLPPIPKKSLINMTSWRRKGTSELGNK
jgi:hypothetical protein